VCRTGGAKGTGRDNWALIKALCFREMALANIPSTDSWSKISVPVMSERKGGELEREEGHHAALFDNAL